MKKKVLLTFKLVYIDHSEAIFKLIPRKKNQLINFVRKCYISKSQLLESTKEILYPFSLKVKSLTFLAR